MTKLISSDGQELTVRDLGPVLVRVTRRPGGPPIKLNGRDVVPDEAARSVIRGLIDAGLYEHEFYRE